MDISNKDKEILRGLASQIAEIASSDEHAETAEKWRRMNDLDSVRPMVKIYQLPWRELDVDGELELKCEGDWARRVENGFRQTIYQWHHMRWDMVIEPVFYVGYHVHSTGVGIKTSMQQIAHDANGGVTAKHYDCQIGNEDDLDKIKMPELTFDKEGTEAESQQAAKLFDGILKVETRGRTAHNYAPWDRLSEWCNPEQVLMDLALRPEFIHAAMDRLTSAYMHELDQLEELNALSIGNGNRTIGQGGNGQTNDLPKPADGEPVRLKHQWCGSMAQIFSEVSPDMHEEFALAYEKKFLNRAGLSYYGCCEPLDRKVDIIAKHLPNLRKISMSPWVDHKRGADACAGRFVYSAKPNPAFLATDNQWDRDSARKEIESILAATEGKNVEFILKDVSTVRFEPKRVWEWTEMVMSMARGCET